MSRYSVAQVGGRLWQADLCNLEVLRLCDASLVRPLRCDGWLSCWFACLSLQADHPQLATCMQAQSPPSHSWRLQSEPSEFSSLMAIPHKCRLYRHVIPDGIPYASVMAHDMFTLQELWEKIVGKVLHGWYRPYINHKHNRILNQNSIGWRFYAYISL